MPNNRKVASVQTVSRRTNGRAINDSQSIGRDTSRATLSGNIWPTRLGTSSPKMMVRKVMITTTIAVAVISAARSWMGKVACSHLANGAENAASPTMPFITLIEVMPICTVDRNLVGLSCSSIAACAPASPVSTITCRRALRLAVSAISDMANMALTRIRKIRRTTSIRGARNREVGQRSRIGA